MPSRESNNTQPSGGSISLSPSQFNSFISPDPDAEFPAEADRYVLYLHLGCPFAHRTNIIYHLKQLQSLVALSIVSIHRNPIDNSWAYDGTAGSSSRDPIHGFRTLRELYERASPGYAGRCSVPVLWDRRSESIVSNDSSAILRMLSTCFDELLPAERRESCKPHGALLPKELRGEIEELNERIAGDVSWGVYRAGMALDQEGYDEAMRKLFERLDGLEARLSDGRRFLFGEQLTETDILLFPTIVRFDMAYVTVFQLGWKQIRYDYLHLHRWVRRLYWEVDEENKGAFKGTTNFDIFMEGYANAAKGQKIVPWGPAVHILPWDG